MALPGWIPANVPRSRVALAITTLVVLGIAAVVGFQLLAAPATSRTDSQSVRVRQGTLATVLNATGNVAEARHADLGFGTAGRLKELNVSLGQTVAAGDVLARLETGDLDARLQQARAIQRAAELKLQQVKAGASPEEVSAAQAALAAAQAKAKDIAAGSPSLEVQAAEASVAAAQANLASATAKRTQLQAGPSPVDVAAAEEAVAIARANVQKALADLAKLKAGPSQLDLESARLAVEQAKQAFLASQVERDWACGNDGNSGTCKAHDSAVWVAQLQVRQAELKVQQLQAPTPPEALAAELAVVDSALKGQRTAEVRRQQVLAGASAADLEAARSAEEAAKADLRGAQVKLEQLRAGAKASEIQAAQAAVASATAALASRTSARTVDLALAEAEVQAADAGVQQAQLALDSTLIKAPFGGVVTSVGAGVGEQVLGNTTVVGLMDPHAVRVDATVHEVDVPRLKPGQTAQILLDSLGSRRFAGRVSAVSSVVAPQQGATGYLVSVDFDPGDARLVPGMRASVDITVDGSANAGKDGVLLVPNRAVSRQGSDYVVKVPVNGQAETRVVRVGGSGDQYTEILAGLADGDTVLLPQRTGTSSGSGN